MPASSPSSTPTRRLTRSQTATTVLGKRTSLSRSSSIIPNRSTGMITPDSTPIAKRKRTATRLEEDGTANKENIPPPPMSEISLLDSPRSRLSRRSSFSSDISTVSTRSRISVASSIRRSSTYSALPQTGSSAIDAFTCITPPPSPPSGIPFYLRVRGLLRATSNSNNPMSMEGREGERSAIVSFLHSLDGESDVTDSVLYVSGTPGTGKTALVNSIVASTKVADGVKVVFVNCMAITNMDALWEKLADEMGATPARGRGAAKKVLAKDRVHSIFGKQRDLKCILVLDELDSLVATASNDIQSLFSLVAAHPSMLRIMGIANTHTLTSTSILPQSVGTTPDAPGASALKGIKVKTIHFAPYNPSELLAILNKRFEELPQDELKKLLPTPTLTLLTKKVSTQTGDVRVLFEILRGAIDNAVSASSDSSEVAAAKVTVSPAHVLSALKAYAPASTTTISKSGATASSTSGNSEIVSKVRGLGLQQRLVLLGLVLASKRLSATLPLSKAAFFASITPPSTPTKRPRSPVKRASSSGCINLPIDSSTSSSGIESTQLHSYYSSLLSDSDAFTPLPRSEFSDLLGILETTGIVSLCTQSQRSLKRSASFAGSVKSSGANGSQSVSLAAHIREGEVIRGLGIGSGASSNVEGDALEDIVKTIWSREMSQIRREVKAKKALFMLEGVEGFEDAIEG